MSKRTASRSRVSVSTSMPTNATLVTGQDGIRRLVSKSGTVRTSGIVIDDSTPDGSEIDVDDIRLSFKRDIATLLVPAQSCIVRRCRPYLTAAGAKLRQYSNGTREYSLEHVPKDMLVPRHCRLIIAIVPAEGTGTDQHMKETRSGHAQRRDYSAKKGPKRTFRVDGVPNGEEVGRPIQGESDLTPLSNRDAAREYWH